MQQMKKSQVTGVNLLAVPQYSDLLEDMDAEDESDHGRALVTTEASWRTEWQSGLERLMLRKLNMKQQ